METRLNLGANDRRVEGFVSVDVCQPADVIADLNNRWPWTDSSVDEVLAFDVFEHLLSKWFTMNELYRVLKPGGRATIEVPCAAHGAGAFQDPTHVSYWTGNDFAYYELGNYARERFRGSSYYGIQADFKFIEKPQCTRYMDICDEVFKCRVVLEAVK